MADKKEDPIRYSRISPDMRGNYTALSHDYVGGNEDIKSSRPKRLIDYIAHDREGNSLAYAQVRQSEGWTHTYMDGARSPNDRDQPIVDMERTDVPRRQVRSNDFTNTYNALPGEQLVMFGIDHTPTARIVHSLYARDSTAGKLATMNILGIADNASRDALNHGLLPDDNLSEHSLNLVKKLHKKGAIPDTDLPDELTQGNDLSFDNAEYILDTQHTSKFDNGELINLNHRLPHAKARIRKALGRSAPTLNTEPKNEQLQLEGFE